MSTEGLLVDLNERRGDKRRDCGGEMSAATFLTCTHFITGRAKSALRLEQCIKIIGSLPSSVENHFHLPPRLAAGFSSRPCGRDTWRLHFSHFRNNVASRCDNQSLPTRGVVTFRLAAHSDFPPYN